MWSMNSGRFVETMIGVGARQPRRHERGGGRDDEIQFSGQQCLDHDGARADRDNLGLKAVLFEEAFLIGNPDRCV